MIKWTEKTIKVSALRPFERNPRKISEEDFTRLKKSLQENGYHQRIIATIDLRVIGGHQRIRALKELGYREVQVLVPDKTLGDAQFKKLLIQDNLPFGQWDFDILSSDFDVDELIGFGMPESWLGLGEEEGTKTADGDGGESQDEASRIVPCPKCGHEFSILAEQKPKKR